MFRRNVLLPSSLIAGFLLGVLFDPEYGGRFLRNDGELLQTTWLYISEDAVFTCSSGYEFRYSYKSFNHYHKIPPLDHIPNQYTRN
jgi:hypothetical protein